MKTDDTKLHVLVAPEYTLEETWTLIKELGFITENNTSKTTTIRRLLNPRVINALHRYSEFVAKGLFGGDVVRSNVDGQTYLVKYQYFNLKEEKFTKILVSDKDSKTCELNEGDYVVLYKQEQL